jgi:hypothetical protein
MTGNVYREASMSGLNATFIHELRHRLQTLEIDLQEASHSGQITEHDFHVRLQRLARANQHAEKLLAIISAQIEPADLPTQVDLPMMSDTSSTEQKIVNTFVTDTKVYVTELAEKIVRVGNWSQDAAHGNLSWLTTVWRLLWIKRQLRRADGDIESVRKARGVVEDFISKSSLAGSEPVTRKNQKDLLSAFQEFEAATGRVTALRARLRGEISKNDDMRTWLQQYAANRKNTVAANLPPEPDHLSEAYKGLAERLTGGAKMAGERLVIARQLASALSADHNGAAAEVTTPAPDKRKRTIESQKSSKGARA